MAALGVAAAIGLDAASPATADEVDFGGGAGSEGDLVGEAEVPDGSTDAAEIVEGGGSAVVWIGIPVWRLSGDPDLNHGYCRGIRYVAADTWEEALALRHEAERDYLALWSRLLANEAPGIAPDVDCPTDPAERIPPVVLRDAVRGAVVDRLPRPDPQVPPGWALTGMPAYLVTGHDLAFGPVTHTIDLGELAVVVEIVATGRSVVDWGDGTVTAHEVPGTPWPDGQVHHTYRDAGGVTVAVTDHWTVDFTVVSPVTITDRVEAVLAPRSLDLEVRQLQAVRVAPGA